MTFETILESAASLLNDTSQYVWTEDALLPYLRLAWKELLLRSKERGLSATQEVSAALQISVGDTSITRTDISDLGRPVEVFERLYDSSDEYVKMTEISWESPGPDPVGELLYWTWREGEIKLIGALTIRDVLVRYIKNDIPISSMTTTVPVPFEDSEVALTYRTAGLAAGLSGGNLKRAEELNTVAKMHLDSFFNIQIKDKQVVKIARHKGYRR